MAVNYPSSPERSIQEHLSALNGPIEAVASVAHPFETKDLSMGGPEGKDVFPLPETVAAYDVGADHVLSVIRARFPKPDGTFNETVFTPIFDKKDAWQERGAVQIIEANSDVELPQREAQEIAKGDTKKQKKLNEELAAAASTIPGKKYRSLNIPDLADYTVHDVNPGRFVTVSVTTSDGQRFPVILNTMDASTGMEGHIFVAEHPESGDYALLEQPKPVVGQKKIGPPQGFAGPLEKGGTYQGLQDEMGIDLLSASIQTTLLEEDLTACLVDDRFFLLHLNRTHEDILNKPDLLQNVGTQLDKLAKMRMSKQETLHAIQSGTINGAHAVAGIALSALDRGVVALNPNIDANKRGLILKRLRPRFDPGRERLTLFRGNVNTGASAGVMYADPTKFRDETPIREVDKKLVDLRGGVFASYADIVQELRGGSGVRSNLGVVETAAIFSHCLKNGILVPTSN